VVALVAGVSRPTSAPTAGQGRRKAGKGPPPCGHGGAGDAGNVPIRLQAIGNVEAYSTVALKARVDGEIVAVNFREGALVKRATYCSASTHGLRGGAAPGRGYACAMWLRAVRRARRTGATRTAPRRISSPRKAYAQIRTTLRRRGVAKRASSLENRTPESRVLPHHSPLDGYVGKVLLAGGNLVKANDVSALV